jgi:hypothetical protein
MIRERSAVWSFVALTAASALILVVGGPEDRFIGWVGVAFFGGIGLVYLALTASDDHGWRRARRLRRARAGRRPAPQLPPRITVGPVPGARRGPVHGDGVGTVLATTGPARFGAALVGCLLFVGLGALMLVGAWTGDAPAAFGLVGAVTVLVFGGFAVGAVVGAVRPGGLALLPEGLLSVQPAGSAFVPWEAVTGLAEVEIGGHPLLAVAVADHPAVRFRGVLGPLRPLQRRLTGGDLVVASIGGLSVAELSQVVQGLLRHPGSRSQLASTDQGLATVRKFAQERAR